MTHSVSERIPVNSRIRSFVRRQGRVTAAQRNALDNLWRRYVLPADQPLNANDVFVDNASLVLEIGFGDGLSLVEMATANPRHNYLGIEVYRPGVGRLMNMLDQKGLDNVRIYSADAIDVLSQCIADASLDGINVFFPDPWPKKRHHKRRLVDAYFAVLTARKLKPGGVLRTATDWEDYARQMLEVLESVAQLENLSHEGQFLENRGSRPATKFEKRGLRLGHKIWDLNFGKRSFSEERSNEFGPDLGIEQKRRAKK